MMVLVVIIDHGVFAFIFMKVVFVVVVVVVVVVDKFKYFGVILLDHQSYCRQ